jgi:hypothetical protein
VLINLNISPRKNTTKYGENAKIPTKRAKKQGGTVLLNQQCKRWHLTRQDSPKEEPSKKN